MLAMEPLHVEDQSDVETNNSIRHPFGERLPASGLCKRVATPTVMLLSLLFCGFVGASLEEGLTADMSCMLQLPGQGRTACKSPTCSKVGVEGGRFVDATGRERLFRGVNVVYKDAPWLPDTSVFHANLSFAPADVELLRSLGVNLIRLGVMWPGVVPHCRGKVDWAYLEKVKELIQMAAKAGIYTIVEPHQDEFNPRFCGEGVPDWWTKEFTATTDFPVPVRSTPFTTDPPSRAQCDLNVSFDFQWAHDTAKAVQTMWDRGAEDFGDYWVVVARFLAPEPSVIGGELWNEPFPGDVYGQPKFRNNTISDRANLQPFYEKVTAGIRAVASQSQTHSFVLGYEPSWPVGTQNIHPDDELTSTSGFESLPEKDAIYAFHYYSPPCPQNFTATLDARLADAHRLGAVPYASELWLHAEDEASQQDMAQKLDALESRLISYTGWQYKSYSGSLPGGTCTGCGNSFFDDSGALMPFMTRAMARPFAGAVAGKTMSVTLNQDRYDLQYTCGSAGPTELFISDLWLEDAEMDVEVMGDAGFKIQKTRREGLQSPVPVASYWELKIHHSVDAQKYSASVKVTVAKRVR